MEFIRDRMAPAHGYKRSLAGAREYLQACNPAHASNCAIPVLVLGTTNDTLATAEMAQTVHSMYKASPHVVTALTRQGTHMVRWEGWWPRDWTSRVSAEFLESALQPCAPSGGASKSKAVPPAAVSSLCGHGVR